MRGWIDRYGAIYLGQKFNVWLWDFEQNTLLTACKKSELLSFDQQYSGIFVDQVYQTDYFDPQLSQLKYSFDQE